MTSDEFNSQYKLLKQITGKGGRSYTAEHLPSGRAVLVHILEENQVGGAAGLDALLERLPPRDKSRVLDTLTVDRSLVVVTQFLQGFEGFQDWLREKTAGTAPPAAPPTGSPPQSHGEFTQLFRSSGDAPPPARDRAPAEVVKPPTPAPAAGSQFTDLFRAAGAPPAQTQGPDRATIPPVRMVGVRVPPPPVPALPPEMEPPRLTPNFGPGREPAAQPDPVAGWPRPDEVIIRTGEPAPPPLPPPSWEGPSEFTRQLGIVSQPTGELSTAAGVAAPQEEAGERKRSYLPLFLLLNLVFILATGLVVYFALRRC
jgi:hypothetical protein